VIDLHCHILPGLDDGSRDLDDSVAMARQAAADGIEVVAATPHIHPDHEVLIHELEDRVGRLNAALAEEGVGVRVVTGGEVSEPLLDELDDDDLRRVSLGGGGWVLVEPRPGPLSAAQSDFAAEGSLLSNSGVAPSIRAVAADGISSASMISQRRCFS